MVVGMAVAVVVSIDRLAPDGRLLVDVHLRSCNFPTPAARWVKNIHTAASNPVRGLHSVGGGSEDGVWW